MNRKVIKIGTSAGITISKKMLKELGLEIGDGIKVNLDKQNGSINISPTVQADEELIDWTKKFIDRYRPALEALSKK